MFFLFHFNVIILYHCDNFQVSDHLQHLSHRFLKPHCIYTNTTYCICVCLFSGAAQLNFSEHSSLTLSFGSSFCLNVSLYSPRDALSELCLLRE